MISSLNIISGLIMFLGFFIFCYLFYLYYVADIDEMLDKKEEIEIQIKKEKDLLSKKIELIFYLKLNKNNISDKNSERIKAEIESINEYEVIKRIKKQEKSLNIIQKKLNMRMG